MDDKEQQLRAELEDLQKQLQDPAIFSDPGYPKLAKRQSELQSLIALFNEKAQLAKSRSEAEELVKSGDGELAELAKSELEELEQKITHNNEALTEALVPKDPNDERDAIIEIRGAAGGDEANLFAGDLYRMYTRWAENHGYKLELI